MSGHNMGLLFGLGALFLAVLGVVLMRVMGKKDLSAAPWPAADAGGGSITIRGRQYGLHTINNLAGAAHWVLSLPVGCPHSFTIHREEGLEWLIQRFGLMKDVQTGAARYDEEFEIRSREPEWTAAFLSDAESRRLVQALFGLDCSAVILDQRKLQVVFEERDALDQGADALSELAARLPRT